MATATDYLAPGCLWPLAAMTTTPTPHTRDYLFTCSVQFFSRSCAVQLCLPIDRLEETARARLYQGANSQSDAGQVAE